MTIATMFLIAFVLLAVIGTAVVLHHDGYRRIPTAPIQRRPDVSDWR